MHHAMYPSTQMAASPRNVHVRSTSSAELVLMELVETTSCQIDKISKMHREDQFIRGGGSVQSTEALAAGTSRTGPSQPTHQKTPPPPTDRLVRLRLEA